MDIKINHFKKHLSKYKSRAITAKQLYYLMETFYNIDYENFDIFLIIDELKLTVEECDNKRGFYYFNEIARYHRNKYKKAQNIALTEVDKNIYTKAFIKFSEEYFKLYKNEK